MPASSSAPKTVSARSMRRSMRTGRRASEKPKKPKATALSAAASRTYTKETST